MRIKEIINEIDNGHHPTDLDGAVEVDEVLLRHGLKTVKDKISLVIDLCTDGATSCEYSGKELLGEIKAILETA